MVFYVIVITFLMKLHMNKLNIVMDDWNVDEIHHNYWNKVWYILHPNEYTVMNDWNLNGKNNLKNGSNHNIVTL